MSIFYTRGKGGENKYKEEILLLKCDDLIERKENGVTFFPFY